jgi:cytochrome b561
MGDGKMSEEYTPVQKVLHWLVALMVLVQVGLGLWIGYAPPDDEAFSNRLFNAHDGTGMLILVTVLVRLAVRQVRHAPPLPRGMPAWAAALAWLNHRALYLVLIIQPLLGWLNNGANGFPWSFYGFFDVPSPIAQNQAMAPLMSRLHFIGAMVLAVLVGMHLAGVFYHTFIRRDGLLRRML